MTPALYLGLMSGTSLDGVDAVLARFEPAPELLASHFLAYPEAIKTDLLALNDPGYDELDRAAGLALRLAELYATAVDELLRRAGVSPDAIAAIGCHGQTVRHHPERGYSLQLNAPAHLAEATGIRVIADFRNRDIAAGGQGAPLVPAFHAARFGHPDVHRVVVNIGGIANLTDLPPGGPVSGYDCAPGNLLLDAWIQRHQGVTFDRDGAWASTGQVLPSLLQRALAHPFFARHAPKSAGREDFSAPWLAGLLHGDEAPEDVQATLLELTAQGIADAVARTGAEAVYVCGGGAHNGALMRRLRQLTGRPVAQTEALGVPADWVEAYAFAWLTRECLAGRPGNLPAVTGATGPRVLGAIYPA